MNRIPLSRRPRLLGAMTALLLAGAAFSAHAGSNVQWSLSVGAPAYAYGPAYAPVAYPAYAPGYVVAPPRPMHRHHRHHRRPVVCDAYGYCTRLAPVAPVVYAPAPVYYPQQVVIAGGGYGYGHGGYRHGHRHGHRR